MDTLRYIQADEMVAMDTYNEHGRKLGLGDEMTWGLFETSLEEFEGTITRVTIRNGFADVLIEGFEASARGLIEACRACPSHEAVVIDYHGAGDDVRAWIYPNGY